MRTDVGSERFVLERFAWAGPDRLELSGRFVDFGRPPGGTPVLVVHGAQQVHRLPAAPDADSEEPEDGESWHAAFTWVEPPEPFSSAELELGDLTVTLPDPGGDEGAEEQPLPVRRPEPVEGASRIGLESELLAAREEVRELRETAEREHEELERAQAALEAERERRAADGERFRTGLAQVRTTAEEALEATAAERDALRDEVTRLEAEARDAAQALASLSTVRESAEAAAADAEQLLGRMQELRHALAEPD
jgi:signal transduction histidine kinase